MTTLSLGELSPLKVISVFKRGCFLRKKAFYFCCGRNVVASDRKRLEELSAGVAQLVEHILGKDEVMGSIPISSLGCVKTKLQ